MPVAKRMIEFPALKYSSKIVRFKLPEIAIKNSLRISLYYNGDKTPRKDFFLENEYKLRRPVHINIISPTEFISIIPVHSLSARVEIMAVAGANLDGIKVTIEE